MTKSPHGNPNPSPDTRFKEGNAGKPKGAKSKYSESRARDAVRAAGLANDERPLTFLLKMMKGEPFKFLVREPGDQRTNRRVARWYYPTPEDMKWAAAQAAPYMHPKLANIEHTGNVNVTHEDFLDKLDNEENGAGRTTRH